MNPLEQLSDIHVPDDVSVWPLAWGWWLLIIISLLLASVSAVSLYRYLRARRVKKMALRELKTLGTDNTALPAKINQLLKRVALSYFPTAPVAALYGEDWCAFLTQQLPKNKQSNFAVAFTQLQQSLYQKNTQANAEAAIETARVWIQSCVPPSKKQLQMTQTKETHNV